MIILCNSNKPINHERLTTVVGRIELNVAYYDKNSLRNKMLMTET